MPGTNLEMWLHLQEPGPISVLATRPVMPLTRQKESSLLFWDRERLAYLPGFLLKTSPPPANRVLSLNQVLYQRAKLHGMYKVREDQFLMSPPPETIPFKMKIGTGTT
jgi:hypothetical protein